MALVAKSYQDLEIVRDTYIENGKRYCDVRTKDGKIKRVKSYTTAEYARYYPDVKIIQPIQFPITSSSFEGAGE